MRTLLTYRVLRQKRAATEVTVAPSTEAAQTGTTTHM
jgi:hypothetical protein